MFTIEVQVHPYGGEPTEDGVLRFACWNTGELHPSSGRGTYGVVDMWENEPPRVAYNRHNGQPQIRVIGHPREHGQGHLAKLAALILDLYARGEDYALCWEME